MSEASLIPAPSRLDRLTAALDAHRAGMLSEAESGYRAVLEEEPTQPTALHLLGVLTQATGRSAAAVDLLRRALTTRGDNLDTRLALADALAATGARDDAIENYKSVLAVAPNHHAALVNLANTLRDTGDIAGAIAACRQVLATAPRLAPAHITLGSAFLAAGKVVQAIGAYRTAVCLQPASGIALTGFAMALLRDRRAIDALDAAKRATEACSGLAEAWFVRGAAERALHRFDAAIQSLKRAITADPGHARAHLCLGNAFSDRDSFEPAEFHLRQAIELEPKLPEAHASLGHLLTSQGRLIEAVKSCDRAVGLKPDFSRAYWNRSFAHMLLGDFARGWEDCEWRKRDEQFAADFNTLPGREWTGGAMGGQTLLVHAEQGLGDTIQFARFLPKLAERGGRIVLAADRTLIRLLGGLPGLADIVPKDRRLPPYDLWVDQMSLPRLLGTRLTSIPFPEGYLKAEPADWTEPRKPSRLRVGLVWAGNPKHSNDSRRSLPPSSLAPLVALQGIDWVNLQVGGRGAELSFMYGLQPPSPRLRDFADTAGLVASLDLVIAVDTSTAHLSGALGKPTWIMLPFAPDWRWMLSRSDSNWYASVRLFRQTSPGDWVGVVNQVTQTLAGLASGGLG